MAQMDPKTQPADETEVFEPVFDWAKDDASDTLIVLLPGFKRQQLKVQITKASILRVSGERPMSEKENKRRIFSREWKLPSHCDANGVSAKFEGGLLYVKLPKMTTPLKPPEKTAPKPLLEDQKEKQGNRVAKEMRAEHGTASRARQMHEIDHGGGFGQGEAKIFEERSPTMDSLARHTQEYKNAFSGWVAQLENRKILANSLVVIFLVLVFGLYVKSVIESSFGGSKSQEL